jgi:trans-aconitate methyltransferase
LQSIDKHNTFYLSEGRKDAPKEYFKFLADLVSNQLSLPSVRVLDIGCATGDFLYYLHSLHPQASLTGTDISPEFLAVAKDVVPNATFRIADISTGKNLPNEKFDIVFMNGVNYLFSDYGSYLRNIISLTARTAYVFGVFNPEDLDVFAHVKRSGDPASVTAWNLISRRSINLFLDGLDVKHRFIDWELTMANPRRHEDPIRSWTVATKEGNPLVVNGMQFIHRFAVLQIDVATAYGDLHKT